MKRLDFVRRVLVAWALAGTACAGGSDHEPSEGAGNGHSDEGAIITDDAHVDVLSIAYDGGVLRLGIHHADHPVDLAPETTLIEVRAGSRTVLEEAPPLPFLGPPGSHVWTFDGGWTVRDVASGVFEHDELSIHLEEVEGPGDVAVWRFGAEAPDVAFTSRESLPKILVVDRSAHTHRNWSFTSPGIYTLRFRISAVTVDDGISIESESRAYRFQVQD